MARSGSGTGVEVDLAGLLARYGSPLYVYELAEVRAALAALRAALPEPSLLYYSLKANPHRRLVRELGGLGCGAEVSSAGELGSALAGGIPAGRCLYTGPGKSRAEIDLALARGVTRFSVESPVDLGKVAHAAAASGRAAEVLLRLNPGAPPRGARLAMSGASPFGTDVDQVVARPGDFRREGAAIAGFHVYSATNLTEPDLLLPRFETALEAAARAASALAVRPRILNLGGGFGHRVGRRGERADLSPLRGRLEALLDARLPGWRRGQPTVAFESGRYLVGAAGTLVCTVEDVKSSNGARFTVLDAGINHLGGMSGLGRLLRDEPDVALLGEADGAEADGTRVVGPLCTPLDVWSTGAHLPGVAPGSVVVVPNVGAYALTASLIGFLSRPCPVELVLDAGRAVEASRLTCERHDLPL